MQAKYIGIIAAFLMESEVKIIAEDFQQYKRTFEDLFLNHKIIVYGNEFQGHSKFGENQVLFMIEEIGLCNFIYREMNYKLKLLKWEDTYYSNLIL
ncbi:hypothetical protein [Clostridium hydrogenum]|uniref:hypothetical protein n=1 Tax=Clostridium hydrogenum TaxID=2855764 RepID=UPI001F238BF1|nr:hypothetical protein [Clostridium hydrogenum]